jgi:hypothetical protein
MSLWLIGLAPARVTRPGGFHLSAIVMVIIAVVAVLAVVAILGWRAPDRAPGEETKAQRDRIED